MHFSSFTPFAPGGIPGFQGINRHRFPEWASLNPRHPSDSDNLIVHLLSTFRRQSDLKDIQKAR
jgi:hypothetical protein